MKTKQKAISDYAVELVYLRAVMKQRNVIKNIPSKKKEYERLNRRDQFRIYIIKIKLFFLWADLEFYGFRQSNVWPYWRAAGIGAVCGVAVTVLYIILN
jgi:hypothetical protein